MSERNLNVSNPSAAKIEQRRKILEELERQKKALGGGSAGSKSGANASGSAGAAPGGSSSSSNLSSGSGGASVASSSSGVSSAGSGASGSANTAEQLQLSSNQRMAMEQANKSSFGYFVPQDSLFGNLILPVIPRIPPPS